ncbi:hypothetical protein [Ornithinimicrobium kibberense]|uniref:hypothetical protein n=1 Tax=Ornithinimicrobium kibberense TaxID=282060 RepID=UPI00360B81CA
MRRAPATRGSLLPVSGLAAIASGHTDDIRCVQHSQRCLPRKRARPEGRRLVRGGRGNHHLEGRLLRRATHPGARDPARQRLARRGRRLLQASPGAHGTDALESAWPGGPLQPPAGTNGPS